MKKVWMNVWIVLMVVGSGAAHAGNDSGFLRKFMNYKAKYNISTLRTAQAFANHLKVKPEQILKRYVAASFAAGGRTQELAVVNGIDALKESGLSHQMALERVSDMVGQLTDTLDAIYKRVRGAAPNTSLVGSTREQSVAARGPVNMGGRGPASWQAR